MQNIRVDVNLISFALTHDTHGRVIRFSPLLIVRQTASRIRGILEGRERAREKKKRGAARRGFTRSTWNTKQNYRLRAQHHHKSQVYGYVGRIRA